MRSERVRLLVFSLFFVVLIIFGVLYRPPDAQSRPAESTSSAVLPQG